jgi:hypothetical protein
MTHSRMLSNKEEVLFNNVNPQKRILFIILFRHDA